MLTDDERTAAAVAERLGISEYRSQVLPTDKAAVILAVFRRKATRWPCSATDHDSPAPSACPPPTWGDLSDGGSGPGSGGGRGADGMPS